MPKRRKKTPKGCEKRGRYYHCRIQSPAKFDRRSFRTITRGKIKLVIGCPKGKWSVKKKRCTVGTRAQKRLIPV